MRMRVDRDAVWIEAGVSFDVERRRVSLIVVQRAADGLIITSQVDHGDIPQEPYAPPEEPTP